MALINIELCDNYYKLGRYYFTACPTNMGTKDKVGKECQCTDYYYKDTITATSKTLFYCYGEKLNRTQAIILKKEGKLKIDKEWDIMILLDVHLLVNKMSSYIHLVK